MAYEVEAVAPTVTPVDASNASSAVMREDRVVEPYRQRRMPTPSTEVTKEPIGQENTHGESEAVKTVESESKPTEETVTLSPQMAALARREQAFRRQQQEFKAQMAAAQAQFAELAELNQIKDRVAKKDFSDIEKLIPYDAYTQYLIDKGATVTPEQETLKKVETKLEQMERQQKEREERDEQTAVSQRRDAVKELVETSQDFATIKELKQEEAVVQHILETWKEDGLELSIDQAAKEVEEILIEKAKQWASVTKIKQTVAPEAEEKKQLPPLKPAAKTLTNDMTIQGEAKPTRKSFQGMTDAERYAEARRRAEERLKQGLR